jgi:hypothetical protein
VATTLDRDRAGLDGVGREAFGVARDDGERAGMDARDTGRLASTPVSVVTPIAELSVNVPQSPASVPVALPRSVCVGLPVTPIRWFAIVPEFPAVSMQEVQRSTPVVSLLPVAACAIRKIVVWNGPVTPLVTLVKWPSIVVFVTRSPFASVNVVVTRVVGSVTSVKTDGTGGSPVAIAASARALVG